jgi:uncharacterized protein (DUF2336 family)
MTVDFPFMGEIEDAIARGTPGRRHEMLQRVTDLFVVGATRYQDAEVALFDDVISRLAVDIEISARALLAVRLAPIGNAPPNIVRTLAFDDEIDVAGPVLVRSDRLDDRALVENASIKSQEHLLAISRRRSLSEAVTDVLVVRGDRQVVLSTVENRGARFSEAGFVNLLRRSEDDDGMTWSVGSRPEIPPGLFLKLLERASAAARTRLEAAYPDRIREVRGAVAEVTNRVRADSLDSAADYSAALALVDPLAHAGLLDDAKVREFATAGRFQETAVALALMCDLPVPFVDRAMNEKRSETVLILAKVIGLSWATVKAILSLRAGIQGVPAEELAQNLAHFERLKSATANEIVGFYRSRAQARTGGTSTDGESGPAALN